ncbi:ribosome-associated heat shock protein Hsp15 [Sphingomonas gellani]|uniref:Ribosome-associated heat shock protein Hsp15 n=1 Tax=Sphingomonas gellani TaxID=1166340 RepID=A0A1H8JK03_9SPHN|nr:RNA-binding S4 domain-containing protein [Sphingomonas gellani]SEN81059.1 ribosome-associated heat shock protein Hsp15 [Sphingomonas gellani]
MADANAVTMRLDRFLWFARLAKTRTVAQDLAATGRLRCDGRLIDRAHAPVRVGNVLTFAAHGHVRTVRVEALPARRGPAPEARACYSELSTEPDGKDKNRSHEPALD